MATWATSASLVLTRPLNSAPTAAWHQVTANTAANATVQPGSSVVLTEAGARDASSRQEQAPVGEPSTETAAGDSLTFSMREVGHMGRTAKVKVGADEVQMTAEKIQVGTEQVQVSSTPKSCPLLA